MKKNKRRIFAIIASLLIIVLIAISLVYFNTQENNVEIKSSLKAYNAELEENEHMHLEEDASGDKVPVPNGYVGSKVAGENEIDTGYVIYEGEEEVTDENVEEAQKTRNQYVWVPVPDASTMYGIDENGKKWGKLYTFTTETGESIDPVTGAKPLNWTESDDIIKIISKNSYMEPDIIKNGGNTAYDMNSRLRSLEIGVETTHEFLIQLEEEFNYMIESIEKYGGFYIGRYETGDLTQEKAVVIKGNNDIANQNWYKMYKRCKGLNNENTNVETGIIWGNQLDRTLMWLIESGNKTKDEICGDSSNWGNYKNATFEYVNSDGDITIKNSGTSTRIPTGSTEYTKANNIYDLAGNICDWTSSGKRESRGGSYDDIGSSKTAYSRSSSYPPNNYRIVRLSFSTIYKII